MNYLKKGFQETIKAIKKHKTLFLILFILQLVLLASFGTVGYVYQIKILENVQNIVVPLQEMQTDQASLEAGQLFGPEIMEVYQSYQTLIKDIIYFLLWLAGLFLILNGVVWILAHKLVGRLKSWQARTQARLKFTAASVVIMGPLLVASYYIVRSLVGLEMDMESFSTAVKIISYVILAGYYLLLVSFAFIHLNSWKQFVKKFFKAGIVEIHLTVPVLVINFALIVGNVYLLYYLLTYHQSFALVILSTVLLVLILVLTKLFWISCLEEIVE